MIEKAKMLVTELLDGENSGHGMEHINRVTDLALKFAEKENCNKDIVLLSALLHDADDYKLFGEESQKNLINTTRILNEIGASEVVTNEVKNIVKTIGYRKRLSGICPSSIEGKIVSDADMCDAIGANGILRIYQYQSKYNKPFFDKNIKPAKEYQATKCAETGVAHVFEKILKLKKYILTESGKQEIERRHNFTVDFLMQIFQEEDAKDWQDYLTNYLKENYN